MSTNSGKPAIRMAQYGTKHAHARGVLSVMLADSEVDVTGVFEPDAERRIQLEQAGEKPWSEVNWYDDPSEFLDDPTITAVASEGSNAESLDHTDAIIDAGKHAFYDKPAGDDYGRFESIVARAKEKSLLIQMGYMFRYHDGFERILSWANSGVLGHLFSVRAHISTSIPNEYRAALAEFKGGVFYDLAGHVIDLVVYILGRPKEVTSFMQNADTSGPPIPDKHSQRLRVRHGSGIHRHSGDGSAADGEAFRSLRNGRIGDHGALRAGGYASTVPAGAKGGISSRSIDPEARGASALRKESGGVRERHSGRESSPTAAWITSCWCRRPCFAPPEGLSRQPN